LPAEGELLARVAGDCTGVDMKAVSGATVGVFSGGGVTVGVRGAGARAAAGAGARIADHCGRTRHCGSNADKSGSARSPAIVSDQTRCRTAADARQRAAVARPASAKSTAPFNATSTIVGMAEDITVEMDVPMIILSFSLAR
jgi:hypothetical protein